MTLEEAQSEILRLNEELATANTQLESYQTQVDTLTADLQRVRTINQEYFLKLSAQYKPPTATPEQAEPETPTCEDFARTLDI